ncbi:MAG: hypothetical protein OEZ34_13245 [Spirochaetia bacterium]|nr:hypothetical protein [Spirochaetia bacterium]
MAYSLLENIHRLPEDEVNRLQKTLGIILRNSSETEKLRSSVQNIYIKIGDPASYMKRKKGSEDAVNSLFRLMDAFGAMHISQLESCELSALKENPYTVWPDQETCMIAEEAMDYFSESFETLPSDYLFKYLRQLSAKEKKAWARWIGLDFNSANDRMRNRLLYKKLARLRFENEKKYSEEIHVKYLEDLFPDEPVKFQVAWYYRGVLSFYDSLSRMEAENKDLSAPQIHILNLFKTGKMFISKEKPDFGCRSKNKIVISRESHPERKMSGIFEPEHLVSEKESLFK